MSMSNSNGNGSGGAPMFQMPEEGTWDSSSAEEPGWGEAPSQQYTGGGIFDNSVAGPTFSDGVEPQPKPNQVPQLQPPPQTAPRPAPPPHQPPQAIRPMPAAPQLMRPPGQNLGPAAATMDLVPMEQGQYMPPPEMAIPGMGYAKEFPKGSLAHTLGLSVVAVAAGTLLGVKYGGGYGGLAGGIFGGALVNAYRAMRYYQMGTPDADKEAQVSGSYAVGAAILGAIVTAKLAKATDAGKTLMQANPDDDYDDNPGCNIRRSGP